ncbi:MAG: F0F1 ATP synthase subunit A [Spirochaetia bacterium]|nr:F0F1 ATP synthase subunit A [Spirochaetia bacterium]
MNSLALVFALTLAQAPANNQGQIVPLQKVESGVSAKETSVKEDGAEAASADVHESAESFDLNEVINHHLGDVRLRDFYIMGYNFPITKRVAMMWVAMTLLLVILIPAARSISRNAAKRPGRFTSMIEVFVTFIRQDVGENTMGHHSRSYEPFLLTLFFFILFCNLIGLIPPMGEIAVKAGELFGYQFHLEPGDIPLPLKIWSGITPTGDLSVTATLAITSFFIIQISGLVYQGIAYIKNIVPAGIPWIMWPILWPIEVLGQFTKPFALAIRLLANMTAGHMIILVFLGFIFQFQQLAIIPLSISISVAIYLLEIFVALLQAYIFVFLTALFIAGSQHRH